jgi:hypothetical protein
MSDIDVPSFKLRVEITDPNLVAWLEEIPEEHLGARVQDTLRAGHFVLNLVQAAAGEEQMSRYFRPVTDQMERLEGTLEDIMGRARVSQQIGKLGEQFAVNQLTEAFPGDRFDDVSDKSQEADIRAYFDVGDEQPVEARIEVKLYSDDVPTAQLDKFRRDLRKTGVRFGLMVSMASRLTGMKTPLKIEEVEGALAVFVSRAGLDGVRLIAAAAMLKAIILYHARAGAAHRVTAAAIRQAWTRLSAEIEELQDIARQVAESIIVASALVAEFRRHALPSLPFPRSRASTRASIAAGSLPEMVISWFLTSSIVGSISVGLSPTGKTTSRRDLVPAVRAMGSPERERVQVPLSARWMSRPWASASSWRRRNAGARLSLAVPRRSSSARTASVGVAAGRAGG